MSSNTHIRLPASTPNRRILDVISRLVGQPLARVAQEKGRRGRGLGDPALPASEDNPWTVSFDEVPGRARNPRSGRGIQVIDMEGMDAEMAHVQFRDAGGNYHSWYLHMPGADENEFKLLSPGAHAMALAVGRRLVDFFGGNLTEDDSSDSVDYRVRPAKALLPPKTKDQDPNDRYYQYHNALANLTPLTTADLEWAEERMGSGDAHMPALKSALDELERIRDIAALKASMEDTLPKARPGPASKKRHL
jgi:hypothetical protein